MSTKTLECAIARQGALAPPSPHDVHCPFGRSDKKTELAKLQELVLRNESLKAQVRVGLHLVHKQI